MDEYNLLNIILAMQIHEYPDLLDYYYESMLDLYNCEFCICVVMNLYVFDVKRSY